MQKNLLALSAIVLLATSTGCTETGTAGERHGSYSQAYKSTVSMNATQKFVHDAAIGNEFEIASSRMALARSRNNDVRKFAREMIRDHSDAAGDLESAAGASRQTSRDDAHAELDNKHQNMLSQLDAANEDFDRRYVKAQTDAHNEAVNLFSSYAKSGKDKFLKRFAARTLPTLKKHQQHVRELRKDI